MKSTDRDEMLDKDLMGLYFVYSTSGGHHAVSLDDELQVRFEKMGYPYDLTHEGYDDKMKIAGIMLRKVSLIYFLKSQFAPFLRSDVPQTVEGWTKYIEDHEPKEMIRNFDDPKYWVKDAWRMVPYKGDMAPWKPSQGIINWGRKRIPNKEEK